MLLQAKQQVETVLQQLQQRKSNLCCDEVQSLLESLGFEVRAGRAGHKIVVHQGITSFHSASFNCGHGKNPQIKPAYISNLKRVIETHRQPLELYLEGQI